MNNSSPELEELFAHIKAQHRYDPRAWLGTGEENETPRQRYLAWRKAHTMEHRKWFDFLNADEWLILKHSIGSRDTKTNKRVPMMCNDCGKHHRRNKSCFGS